MSKSGRRAAELIRTHRDELMDRWEALVRKEVEPARDQESLLIRDEMITLFEQLERALDELEDSGGDLSSRRTEIDTPATREHGRLRTTMPGYSLDAVIHEYALLRHTIVDLLNEHDVMDSSISEVVTRLHEQAVLRAALEFSKALAEVREIVASTLLHDLRTPLNAARLTVQLLTKDPPPERARVDELAALAERSLLRVDDMIRQVLTAMRLSTGQILRIEPEEEDLIPLVEACLESARLAFPTRIQSEVPKGPVKAFVSHDVISRAMENLLGNALKHGDSERPVTFRLEALPHEVVLVFHNWGVLQRGHDQNPLELFVAYQRARQAQKRQVDGWGLGLGYARAAAEAHGGSLDFESSAEAGTTFRLRLPRRPPAQEEVRPARS